MTSLSNPHFALSFLAAFALAVGCGTEDFRQGPDAGSHEKADDPDTVGGLAAFCVVDPECDEGFKCSFSACLPETWTEPEEREGLRIGDYAWLAGGFWATVLRRSWPLEPGDACSVGERPTSITILGFEDEASVVARLTFAGPRATAPTQCARASEVIVTARLDQVAAALQ